MNACKLSDSRSTSRAVRAALRSRTAAIVAGALALPAAGAVHSAPFPAEFELASLLPANGGDGSEGFVLEGIGDSDDTGSSVAAAGDVNGDGISDVIVGAAWADDGDDRINAGKAWILFGSASGFGPVLPLAELDPVNGGDGSRGVTLVGAAQTSAGVAVSGRGDINGDGFDEVLIGAPRAVQAGGRSYAGHTHVLFGRATFPAKLDLAAFATGDGSDGFTLQGILGRSGAALDLLDDVNGDGLDDILIAAPRAGLSDFDLINAGQSYLVFGRADGFAPLTELMSLFPADGGDGSEGTVFDGRVFEAVAGESVSDVGDVNGDGFTDFAIGSPGAARYHGETYVIFGRHDGYPPRFPLGALLPQNGGRGRAGFVLHSSESVFTLGSHVAGAGDVNGDGIDDLIVGTSSSVSASYVLFGRAGGFPPVVSLSALHPGQGGDGSEGFLLAGTKPDWYSSTVAGIGDVNGDGLDDVLIGFLYAEVQGSLSGRCYVVFGRNTLFAPTFALGSLLQANGGDGSLGFVLNGDEHGDNTCQSASAAGDVNADGVDDVVIGSPDADLSDLPQERGAAYLVFGRAQTG
jgi:hypothetical protein